MIPLIVESVVSVILLMFVSWRAYIATGIRREIAALRKAGYPATLAELNEWYAEPPQGQNAAPLFLAMLDRLYDLPERFERLTPEELQELRETLQGHDEEMLAALGDLSEDVGRERTLVSAMLHRFFPQDMEVSEVPAPRPEQKEAAERAMRQNEEARKHQSHATEQMRKCEIGSSEHEEWWEATRKWHRIGREAWNNWEQAIFGHDPNWWKRTSLGNDLDRLLDRQHLFPEAFKKAPPPDSRALSDDTREVLRAYMTRHADGLRELHHIAAMPDWRFPLDLRRWRETCAWEHRAVSEVSRLLPWEAIYHAEAGNAEAATSALEACFSFARARAAEPLAHSRLDRERFVYDAVNALAHVLSRVLLYPDQLVRIEGAIDRADVPDAWVRAVAGERCITGASGSEPWTTPSAKFGSLLGFDYPWIERFGANPVVVFLYRVSGWGDADRLHALRRFRELIAALQAPDAVDRLRLMPGFRARCRTTPWHRLASRGVVDALNCIAGMMIFSPLEVAKAVLAVERYHRARGMLPAGMDDLVPEFAKQISLDACDGQPLKYRRMDEGYILYSVGLNGKDDGGPDRSPAGTRRTSDDVGMRVRVAH